MSRIDTIERINHLIKDKGVTKIKVAEMCGISPITLSKIINNKIDFVKDSTLSRIESYLQKLNTNEI